MLWSIKSCSRLKPATRCQQTESLQPPSVLPFPDETEYRWGARVAHPQIRPRKIPLHEARLRPPMTVRQSKTKPLTPSRSPGYESLGFALSHFPQVT